MPLAIHLSLTNLRTRTTRAESFHRLPIRIGRHALNDCLVDASDASRFHARIEATTNGLTLVDLGSRNGTWRNDERLAIEQPVPLAAGRDAFRIGVVRFDVRLEGRVEPAAPRPSMSDLHGADPAASALLVLRRLVELYVPRALRPRTVEDVLALGGRLRDALDALATFYAMAPSNARGDSPLHVLRSLLDPAECDARVEAIDADLAEAHVREQRLVRGIESGLSMVLRDRLDDAGLDLDAYLDRHAELFGAELATLRERMLEDATPASLAH